jgi:hypothetical protein
VRKIKKEASMTSAVAGSSAPFGASKSKKKTNVSKPYNESELFENFVALSAINNSMPIQDVVRQRGERWVLFDDDKDTEIASFSNREDAWKRQRQRRTSDKMTKKFKDAESKRQKMSLEPQKAKEPVRADKRENKEVVAEGSMISYVFENNPVSSDSLGWDNFISGLSRQTVLSDPKLKAILQKAAKAEVDILNKATDAVKNVLNKTGHFVVEKKNVNQDPQTGEVQLNFIVKLKSSKSKMDLSVKLQNSRPVIFFPEQTKSLLNSSPTEESKLLRAELIHIQETLLDNMQDVLAVNKNRDEYLKKLEDKVDSMLDGTNPLQIAMTRHLIKMKYKGVK